MHLQILKTIALIYKNMISLLRKITEIKNTFLQDAMEKIKKELILMS